MKIKSYATGGVYTPFVGSTPSAASSTSKKKDGDSDSSTSSSLKSLLDLAKTNMLPSDAEVFLNKWQNVMQKAMIAGSTDLVPVAELADLYQSVDTGGHFLTQFNDAKARVSQKDAASDLMMSGSEVWVMDSESNSLKTVSAKALYENLVGEKPTYVPMTNGEGLLLRESTGMGTGFDSKILNSYEHCTTLAEITKNWKDQTKALATQKLSGQTSSEGTLQEVQHGAQLVLTAGSDVSSSYNLDPRDVDMFVTSLYEGMNDISKNYVRAYMAAHGVDPNDMDRIKKFILEQVTGYIGHSYEMTPDKSNPTGGSTSGSGSDTPSEELTRSEQYARQIGHMYNTYRVSNFKPDPQGKSSFIVNGAEWNYLQNRNGDRIEMISPLEYIFDHAVEASSWDGQAMFIGNQKIDNSTMKQIVSDLGANGKTYVVSMPVKNGNAQNGIDWDLLDDIDKAIPKLKSAKTALEVNTILEEYGISDKVTYDPKTQALNINNELMATFATFGVAASEAVLDKDTVNRFCRDISDQKGYKNILEKVLTDKSKGEKYKTAFWGWNNTIYNANIFIHYQPLPSSMIEQRGQLTKKETRTDINGSFATEAHHGATARAEAANETHNNLD